MGDIVEVVEFEWEENVLEEGVLRGQKMKQQC